MEEPDIMGETEGDSFQAGQRGSRLQSLESEKSCVGHSVIRSATPPKQATPVPETGIIKKASPDLTIPAVALQPLASRQKQKELYPCV